MGIIKKLDPVIIDRIAAGEVIERPASVVKELIENSIDANANQIEIFTKDGGEEIIVIDDGEGILKEDLPLTIEKHATSKIKTLQDIERILSFGFRGEALSSLASISLLEIQSKHITETTGHQLIVRGGEILSLKPFPCNQGTKIIVKELFYATPARKKYLKSHSTENRAILKEIYKLALAKPNIHFSYYRDGKNIFQLPSTKFENLPERMNELFEKNFSNSIIPVFLKKEHITIRGWIGKPRIQNSIADKQYVFINHRAIEIKNLKYIIKNTYGDLLPENSNPIFFLFYDIPPNEIDVNVHPTKKEVRIFQESRIYQYTQEAIRKALLPTIPLQIETYEIKKDNFKNIQKEEKHITSNKNFNIENAKTSILYPIEEILNTKVNVYTIREDHNINHIENISTEELLEISSFVPQKHFGVIFGTYILAVGENDLFIIDQHTAHERINYEKKRKELEGNNWQKQQLIEPITFQLSQEELDIIEENKSKLIELGFSFDIFTNRSLVIREIPNYLEIGKEKDIFIKIVKMIVKGYTKIELYDEYAALKACKASIKRNDVIAPELISQILIDLSKCKEPSRCPHGRPTILKISKSKLDYLFYRKGF